MSRRVALQSNARDICAFIYVVTTHWHNTPEVTCARFKTAKAVFVAGSSGAVIHLREISKFSPTFLRNYRFSPVRIGTPILAQQPQPNRQPKSPHANVLMVSLQMLQPTVQIEAQTVYCTGKLAMATDPAPTSPMSSMPPLNSCTIFAAA